MKKILLKSLLLFAITFVAFSCDSDDNNDTPSWTEPKITDTGMYILNQGKMGNNDASLVYFDLATNVTTKDVFSNQNKMKLGDTGQDIAIYGTKMYVSVTGSNRIYVTNLKGQLLKNGIGEDAIIELKNGTAPQSPYALITNEGKVYASFYGGCIAVIDTTSLAITKTIPVGSYPEKMIIKDKNLYVTERNGNNGEISKKISVVNLTNFSVNSITVAENPTTICQDKNGNIYVASWGNYVDISPSFQKIASGTIDAVEISNKTVTGMAAANDKILLILSGSDFKSQLAYYDLSKNELVEESFLADKTNLPEAQNITVDPHTGNVYICTSDYKNNGVVYIYTSSYDLIKSVSSEGVNPISIGFTKKNNK